jgi:hypothetical protein
MRAFCQPLLSFLISLMSGLCGIFAMRFNGVSQATEVKMRDRLNDGNDQSGGLTF